MFTAICGSQRATFISQLSSSKYVESLGKNSGHRFKSKFPCPLSHFVSPVSFSKRFMGYSSLATAVSKAVEVKQIREINMCTHADIQDDIYPLPALGLIPEI